MVRPGFGFVLLPLYIYPENSSSWQPLIDAATTYPNVTFQAVVNPGNGPGAGNCPDANYINAIASINALPNIETLGYVHTANAYNCGSGGDICVCTQPESAITSNITKYQNWPTAGCTTKDIHVDGIFFDESPSLGNCFNYMKNVSQFARTTMTRGNIVTFNPGVAVNSSYWSLADYINVFENNETVYDSTDIGGLDGNGVYSRQATLLVYNYRSSSAILQRDVNTTLSFRQDSLAGIYFSDLAVYTRFPTFWSTFVAYVAKIVQANISGKY